jgi:hypothetical protein
MLIFFVAFMLAMTAFGAQTDAPAALKGVVLDDSGAVIPGARVTLTNKVTEKSDSAETSPKGEFEFGIDPVDEYAVKVRAQGFQTRDVPVPARSGAAPLRVILDVSEASENVTVSGKFDSPSASDPLDSVFLPDNFIRDLPHKNGDPLAIPILFTAPNITGAEGPALIVDGVEADSLDLPLTAVKQITVNQSPYSPEFSKPGRGRLDVITDKGSRSRIKSNLTFMLRNAAMNARDPFSPVHPLAAREIVDGEADGPITPLLSVMGSFRYDRETAHGVINALLPSGIYNADVPEPIRKTSGFTRFDYRSPSHTHKDIFEYKYKNISDRNHLVGGLNLADRGENVFSHENEIRLLDTNIGQSLLNQFSLSLKQERSDLDSLSPGIALEVLGAFNSGSSRADQHLHESAAILQNYTTLTRGVQTIRFGGTFKARDLHARDGSDFIENYIFSSLDDYLNRTPLALEVNRGNPNVAWTHFEFASFVQDDIRVRPNLSLMLGLRHEAQTRVDHIDNFAPRLAVAYSPGKRGLVVRAGGGIFYERQPLDLERQDLLYNGQRIQQLVVENPTFPATAESLTAVPPSLWRFDPHAALPYLIQAGAGADQRLGRFGVLSAEYYTLRGAHLYRTRNINAPAIWTDRGPIPSADGIRPDPDYVNINQFETAGSSRSNAMTVTFRANRGRKIQLLAQYTLSKTMSDSDRGNFLRLPANNYDLRPEWGPSALDQRHRFNFVGTYRLPKQIRLGWVASYRTGLPYDITTGEDNNGNTVPTERPPGITRNMGRGTSFSNFDLRLAREFRFGADARHLVGVAVEGFNILNHVSYNEFIAVTSSPLFGQPETAFPVRQLQLSMRFAF